MSSVLRGFVTSVVLCACALLNIVAVCRWHIEFTVVVAVHMHDVEHVIASSAFNASATEALVSGFRLFTDVPILFIFVSRALAL